MKRRKLIFLLGFIILSAGCKAPSGQPRPPVRTPPPLHGHQYKIHPNDFAGEARIKPTTPPSPTTFEACFTFWEKTPDDPKYPLYVIPPEIGGVNWILTTPDGRSVVSPCELRAFKMNPDERSGRERGHLKKAVGNTELCRLIDLGRALRGWNLPPGNYQLDVTYSWTRKDRELVGNRCTGEPDHEHCFTIFQGELRATSRITLPAIP